MLPRACPTSGPRPGVAAAGQCVPPRAEMQPCREWRRRTQGHKPGAFSPVVGAWSRGTGQPRPPRTSAPSALTPGPAPTCSDARRLLGGAPGNLVESLTDPRMQEGLAGRGVCVIPERGGEQSLPHLSSPNQRPELRSGTQARLVPCAFGSVPRAGVTAASARRLLHARPFLSAGFGSCLSPGLCSLAPCLASCGWGLESTGEARPGPCGRCPPPPRPEPERQEINHAGPFTAARHWGLPQRTMCTEWGAGKRGREGGDPTWGLGGFGDVMKALTVPSKQGQFKSS